MNSREFKCARLLKDLVEKCNQRLWHPKNQLELLKILPTAAMPQERN